MNRSSSPAETQLMPTERQSPLISCIMPTYGRPEYVHESVRMFLDQDYPATELIIFNDCAGQTFRSEIPNVRVFNVSTRFRTLGEKRNACIEEARGEYLAVWDDDDVYLPWRLSYSLEESQRWNTDFYRPADFLAYWGEDFLHDNQSVPGWLSHSTVLVRKSLWARVGGYPSRDVGEDAEFFSRIHSRLGKDFIKYTIPGIDRFMILRGKSYYQHMSIDGGHHPLNTTKGEYHILPRPIADPQLRQLADQLKAVRSLECTPVAPKRTTGCQDARTPVLSVCISLKNRSRLRHGEQEFELFPNCVQSLRDAAETAGPLELIVADFRSDDWPLEDWLERNSTDMFRVSCINVEGPFSRGRGLNIAARHATSDHLFLCDADILVSSPVIERGRESLNQGKTFFPVCRYTHEDGRLADWQDYGYGLAFVTRDMLTAAGGVPEFESWGGEDDLLHDRLRHHVSEVRQREDGLIHQWHPEACRHVNYRRAATADYRESQQCLAGGSQPVRVFRGQHALWSGPVNEICLYADGRMERPGVDAGTFELEDRVRLVLRWDRWPPETLDWEATSEQFQDQTKRFTLRDTRRESEVLRQATGPALATTRSEFSELAEHLDRIAPFQYLSPPGNWGDAIIRSGTLRFFQQHELKFTEIAHANDAKTDLPVVLGGSGGFCRFWQWSPLAARQCYERSENLVVLPSSYESQSLAWHFERPDCVFYSREHVSLRQIQGHCRTLFCPDMAFWNDVSGFDSSGRGILNAFRTDVEGLGTARQTPDNRDLSLEHDHTGSPRAFFDAIARYSIVRTDRAHIAIAAAMLGRKVMMFPNAYHKNEALFNSSLNRFDVVWNPSVE